MKFLVKKILIVCAFVFGIAFVSHATTCLTVRIHCGDGTGTNGTVCGDDYDDAIEEAMDMFEAVCD
ncbi:hypothetical protein [uncultured Draconibacterium sp.]|uniref:hypothetical protein n=1 Tax=uncultured Draconibacterium sp. TaxID=1573823 RepID=UPI0025F93454|nr:hypothetical protein [uncultured Draconibacterium sp.]